MVTFVAAAEGTAIAEDTKVITSELEAAAASAAATDRNTVFERI